VSEFILNKIELCRPEINKFERGGKNRAAIYALICYLFQSVNK
jgi:hypothetical protein